MKVKSESEVAQSCLTPSDPMSDSVHGIFQAIVLEWVPLPSSCYVRKMMGPLMPVHLCQLVT